VRRLRGRLDVGSLGGLSGAGGCRKHQAGRSKLLETLCPRAESTFTLLRQDKYHIFNFNSVLSTEKTSGGVQNPIYVSAAENSYAAERSYKTGLPLSHKKNNINIYNKNNYL